MPWLVLLPRLSARQAFGWSYLVGLVFFLGSLWWLLHLIPFGGLFAILGWLALCAYLALYFGAFGYLARRLPPALAPCAWVGLEFIRSHALSGFGWNLLGYSQVPSLTAIQVADLGGVWAASGLLVAVNAALARVVLERDRRRMLSAALTVGALMTASAQYGQWRLAQWPAAAAPAARVAVVQGNIPQEQKWDEQFQDRILRGYDTLTAQAARTRPDLIVWPETAVPGLLGIDRAVNSRVQGTAAAANVPLLVGAPMAVADQRGAVHLTNSAALLDPSGAITGRYDKQHLVPFGEFVPGASVFPWLVDALPAIGQFVPGRTPTVFSVPAGGAELRFGVLICFEDVFPELARAAVLRGARLLLTITNDAWFGPTAAAYQHAQASTLRAVELRVPMVRAANTGWSGCIDAAGRWTGSVQDDAGRQLFVSGTTLCEPALSDTITVYRRFGDWLAWLSVLLTAGWLGGSMARRRCLTVG